MDSPPNEPPKSRDAIRSEQWLQVRGGCGCVGILLLVIAGLGALAPMLRWLSVPAAAGGDLVVFANFSAVAGSLLWIGGLTLCALLAALSSRSRVGVTVGVLLVLAAGGWFTWRYAYRGFVAVRIDGREATLGFVFPLPSTTLNRDDIGRLEVVRAEQDENDMSIPMYRLVVTTRGGRQWQSRGTPHRERLERAAELLKPPG